jgi:SCY1-like protein 1
MVWSKEVCDAHSTRRLSDPIPSHTTSTVDSYAFALVIHFVFNPSQPVPPTTHPPHPPPQPSSRGAIPGGIFPLFKKLLTPDPRSRMAVNNFLDIGMSEVSGEGSGFFSHNRLVNICQGLDNFVLSTDSEKSNMIRFVTGLFPRQPALRDPLQFCIFLGW